MKLVGRLPLFLLEPVKYCRTWDETTEERHIIRDEKFSPAIVFGDVVLVGWSGGDVE